VPALLSASGEPLSGAAFAARVARPLDPVHTPAPDWRATAADVATLPPVTRCALRAPAPLGAGGAGGAPRTLLYSRVGKAGSESLKAWLKAHRSRGKRFTFTDWGAHEHMTLSGEAEHVARLAQHARSGWAGLSGGGGGAGGGRVGAAAAARAAEALSGAGAAAARGATAAPRALALDHVFFLNFTRWGLPVRFLYPFGTPFAKHASVGGFLRADVCVRCPSSLI
jgi:hypothetical protein